MLFITREKGQIIVIGPAAHADPRTPIGEVFADGPIRILITQVNDSQTRLGIKAPLSLSVLREEIAIALAQVGQSKSTI